MSDLQILLSQPEISGVLLLPGVVADVVGKKGEYVSIYAWSGDGTGKTRAALAKLSAYAAEHVIVCDPGQPGTVSRAYWEKMLAEGLVESMEDENGRAIRRHDPDQHHVDLNQVLTLSRTVNGGAADADAHRCARVNFDTVMGACNEHAFYRVPCGSHPGSIATVFLRQQGWSKNAEAAGLWCRYMAAGLVDPNGAVAAEVALTSGGQEKGLIHPLEAAVINGNIDAFQVLLDTGADGAMVPTRDWSMSQNTRSLRLAHAPGGPGQTGLGGIADLNEFIWAKIPNPQAAPALVAYATEAAMRRRIGRADVAAAGVAVVAAGVQAGKVRGRQVRRGV